jgi:phospho-N-acetylmuramoyl-pentapeptide-transferase
MVQLLGLSILSAFITAILLVPFIDFLYKIKLQRREQTTKDPFNKRATIFDKFHSWKVGTPVGGGLLIIVVVTVLTLWAYGLFGVTINPWAVVVMLIAFVGFGLLGLYDDIKKLSHSKASFFGLRLRHKLIIQIILAFVIALIFYTKLNGTFINIRGFGLVSLGYFYIPFATAVIVGFANASNIADGLDGLASGLFLICLIAFLAISSQQLDQSLGIFITLLMGSVGAFLYFNIYKARIWLGDVGSLSLGAALAVIGLLTGKTIALVVIGGVFVLEAGSSLLQMFWKKFFKKKLFPVSPLHLLLQQRGWEEPKIVMRAWLLGFFFAIVGLYLALIR